MTQQLQMVDDDYDSDELMWVKAGGPGEKPTIIRQIRSESSSSGSRDNSGGSSCSSARGMCGGGRNLLTVENGTVYRSTTNSTTTPKMNTIDSKNSNESVNALEKLARTSSGESHVIVVNVQDSIYPANVDRQRIQRWKERQSPRMSKREMVTNNNSGSETSPKGKKNNHNHNNNTIERSHFNHPKASSSSPNSKAGTPTTQQRPLSQPASVNSNCSPKGNMNGERCSSANSQHSHHRILAPSNSSGSPFNRLSATAVKTRDEGYTSLTEDCNNKDSDTDSVRSRSLPSTWRPIKNKGGTGGEHEDLRRYAQQITSNTSTDSNYLYHNEGDDFSLSDHNPHSNKNPDCCSMVGDDSQDQTTLLSNSSTERKRLKRKEKRTRLRHNVENALEVCTCFVCVRSAVYHAEDEDDTDSLVDHPCSCDAPSARCCGRWAVIGVMVIFLPFLLCYPPLKACLRIHDKRKKRAKANKKKKKLSKASEAAETLATVDKTTLNRNSDFRNSRTLLQHHLKDDVV